MGMDAGRSRACRSTVCMYVCTYMHVCTYLTYTHMCWISLLCL
jgi:hypothetical protein